MANAALLAVHRRAGLTDLGAGNGSNDLHTQAHAEDRNMSPELPHHVGANSCALWPERPWRDHDAIWADLRHAATRDAVAPMYDTLGATSCQRLYEVPGKGIVVIEDQHTHGG